MEQLLIIAAIMIGTLAFFYLLIFKILGLRIISSNEEQWWRNGGVGRLVKDAMIVLNGETGYAPNCSAAVSSLRSRSCTNTKGVNRLRLTPFKYY
ncbi:hypothetical protein KL86CLO1_12326 [uncultured Eubacteriales bacterium]|uniref:Uncharacterized protein n=1 Tax=uncultured Eubacteriales bacterium TaxID=172733 RepID=A0A212K7Z9_9FIRM|nr:hypothetical protein KL86CLO1_12326 [uncultured Eubacteriales bacterium]